MRLFRSVNLIFAFAVSIALSGAGAFAQSSLTPLQYEIQKQSQRLESAEVEERRDAVARLASMRHPSASRAAIPALRDASAIVRATAASAILSLPGSESASYLIAALNDKDEFVRREAAFALGRTNDPSAAGPLIERLNSDKKDSVRGAAAVALGNLKDSSAVIPLATILSPASGATKKSKQTKDLFLLRSAARALGQIGNSAAVPTLVAALNDEKNSDDVRRECAVALGLIGDTAALPALNGALSAPDPYLAEAAFKAIRRISLEPKVAR